MARHSRGIRSSQENTARPSREEVSLREETELAEAYVGIEQARLGERLHVVWEIADDVMSAQVPPMLLQPIVENAIRRGVARSPNGGALVLAAARTGSRLGLEVRDDGPGPAASSPGASYRTGLGLDNTRRRLAHPYGDEQSLTLGRSNGLTIVRIELPFHVREHYQEIDGAATWRARETLRETSLVIRVA